MEYSVDIERRRLLAATAGSTLGAFGGMPALALSAAQPILTRPIPHSGEPSASCASGSSRGCAATSA